VDRVRRGAEGNFLARFQMNRLSVTGAGESRPAANNATPEGMARNRRVEPLISSNRDGLHRHGRLAETRRSP
jgi:hypothetical protein